MIRGFFRQDGSYDEHDSSKNATPRKTNDKYFSTLSEGHKEVIRWWNETFGRHIPHFRCLDCSDFCRSIGMTVLPKSPEQHEIAFSRFDEFKQFCISKHSK